MDLARHKHKSPAEISEYFSSSWDTREIWRLDVPLESVHAGVAELECRIVPRHCIRAVA